MKVKSTAQLERQIRLLKIEVYQLNKRNKELLRENKLLSAKNQLLESMKK